jgi:hypothetical protein
MVSQLLTEYDEALALLILENNCAGIKEIFEKDAADSKKTIKTKYTCRGFKKSDGGRRWTERGMMQFSEIAVLVDSARNHGTCADIERKIKESYLVVKRKNNDSDSAEDDSDDEAGMWQGRVQHVCVFVCTGIPI